MLESLVELLILCQSCFIFAEHKINVLNLITSLASIMNIISTVITQNLTFHYLEKSLSTSKYL